MIKRSKPARQTVELRPSRIRRDPARVPNNANVQKAAATVSEEREIWGGVAGIVVFAILITIAIVGISFATIFHGDASAKNAPRFGQCYNAGGPDCVIDGQTIYLSGQKLEIANMVAPKIQDAKCDDERTKGIDAAVHLADLLNSGKVTAGAAVSGPDGQPRTQVAVDGRDVGRAMVDAGAARDPTAGSVDWCS